MEDVIITRYLEGIDGNIKLIEWVGSIIEVVIIPKDKIKEIKKVTFFEQHKCIYFLIKEPREKTSLSHFLENVKDEAELNCIYNNEYKNHRTIIYVGETTRTKNRFTNHHKDFWEYAICIRSKIDKGFTTNEIKYLENHFYKKFKKNHNILVENDVIPSGAEITLIQKESIKKYILQIEQILHILDVGLFDLNYEILETTGKMRAEGHILNKKGNILIFEGSEANIKESEGANESLKKRRKELIDNGILKKEKDKYVFSRDYIIKSPSGAAETIMGCNRSANDGWKNK